MDVLKFYDCAKDGNMPTSKYQLDLCLSNYGFMDLVINDRAYRVSEIEKTEHILMSFWIIILGYVKKIKMIFLMTQNT